MDLGLQNRAALVAAASKGLGKAVAFELAREGAAVTICARNRDQLLATRDEIQAETGQDVRALIADVTDRGQIDSVVAEMTKEADRLDILVCNAGGPPSGLVQDLSPADYLAALELNLLSTINLCYAAIPHMKKQKWGRIINITSVSAKQPIDTLVLSNTARAGVLGFSKSLSNQVAPFGITVNCVCPGYTKTERVEELAKAFEDNGKGSVQDFYETIEKMIPAGRFASPEEFAAAVAFLASQRASYITGAALPIDGGFIKALY
jgi:3-oxoacyl-[acyl-carrier protein] reductase